MKLITREFYEDEKNYQRALTILKRISDNLQVKFDYKSNDVTFMAYLLYKVSQEKNASEIMVEVINNRAINLNENILSLIKNKFSKKILKNVSGLLKEYSSKEFALATLASIDEKEIDDTEVTPNSILKLAHKILNVNQSENVADICCGTGSYLITAALNQKNANYFGYDIKMENIAIAIMRAELIDVNIQAEKSDVFSLPIENHRKFDKIFANYPFGIRVRNLNIENNYLEKFTIKYPGFSKATSSDWIFNVLVCDLLKTNGKGIAIMTNGSTCNSIDMPMRKYFVEHKLIECVISLPDKMFNSTKISTSLVVFSNNNNNIRLIDASKICVQGRRQNEFNDQNIDQIIDAFKTDSEYSKKVSIDELRGNEYNLNLSRYTSKELTFSNGVLFESIVTSIRRGAPCTAKQLDKMVSETDTNMQYLMLANIKDGIIDDELPYLSYIDEKYKKYCLENNSLLLSKNGYPYKIAVASVKEGQCILANGNLYIIKLDEKKANPYYIKAFLESEQGCEILKSITVGSTVLNIGIEKLKKIQIPLPSIKVQNQIAKKYKDELQKISKIKKDLDRSVNRLHHIIDEMI